MRTPHECPACDATGKKNGSVCPACKGTGIVWETEPEEAAGVGSDPPQIDGL